MESLKEGKISLPESLSLSLYLCISVCSSGKEPLCYKFIICLNPARYDCGYNPHVFALTHQVWGEMSPCLKLTQTNKNQG